MKDVLIILGGGLIWAAWRFYKRQNPDARIAPDMPTFRKIKNFFKIK